MEAASSILDFEFGAFLFCLMFIAYQVRLAVVAYLRHKRDIEVARAEGLKGKTHHYLGGIHKELQEMNGELKKNGGVR